MADSQLLSVSVATALLIILCTFIVRRLPVAKKPDNPDLISIAPAPTKLSKSLASALPDSVIFPHHPAFKQLTNFYWAQQEREVIPACVVRPCDVQQLCTAVTLIKREYDEGGKPTGEESAQGLFAIRSGGHSPIPGAASVKGGVVIDLSLFCEVTPSQDGSSVVIGTGATWMDVSKVLDEKGLAVAGGRNSAVGVGGLTLGGGLSFFSSRFGMVCSNIISYEIVLASGSVTTASASTNSDLWRALKGGSNNFGIVTRFTAVSFPSTKIWSGFLYMPASHATKVLAAFYEFVNRADSDDPCTAYDKYAAGPLACFTYLHILGVQAISVNLVYTKLPENEKKWPICWKTSSFGSLWRFWSTCKVRTLTSATDEMVDLNPPGKRQVLATTTIKNDPATLAAAHAAYRDAITSIRRVNVKGLSWTLVLQPLLPSWLRKGDPNPLGLQDGNQEPLVLVNFTVNWVEGQDDEFVKTTTRCAIEQIDAVAAANNTGHPYRYLNYCAEWQRPFAGYGVENWRFLKEVSGSYDPEGLFQKGCVGGFKLDVADGEAPYTNHTLQFDLQALATNAIRARQGKQWRVKKGKFSHLNAHENPILSPVTEWLQDCALTGLGSYWYGVRAGTAGAATVRAEEKVPRYASAAEMQAAITELRRVTSDESISTDPDDLKAHGFSEWSTVNIARLPVVVAYPKSTDEVSQIAKVCHRYRIPMVAFSGGSSLEGHTTAPYGGLSIDFTFMDQIVDVHEADGTNAVRYGTMKDWVINLTVVLADGTVIKTRKRPRKSSAGYNLTGLFVGSEGTLGFVTEVTLKLAVIPEETSVAVVTFPTLRDAAAAAIKVIRSGVPVGAVEIMDEVLMSVVNRSGSTTRKWKEVPTLFFKFSGSKAGVRENIAFVKKIAQQYACGDFEFARDLEEQKTLWSARKEMLWSMLAIRPEGADIWSTDVAVPLSRLADILETSKAEMDDLGLFAGILGHVGDGNFHESIFYDSANPNETDAVQHCVHNMVDRALDMDGTCTGEHGIGLGKKDFLVKELGVDTIGVMKSIKQALDPYWLLNPGKIIDVPS
ncbi:MAG: hypothetical protein M1826_005764 [Phylliscum demangeonii]|nr:MAG: hypothetical protein M1826_005764 [Phylliscum demangeonii]